MKRIYNWDNTKVGDYIMLRDLEKKVSVWLGECKVVIRNKPSFFIFAIDGSTKLSHTFTKTWFEEEGWGTYKFQTEKEIQKFKAMRALVNL